LIKNTVATHGLVVLFFESVQVNTKREIFTWLKEIEFAF
jgi:hypothetical protein